jgi:hypothetical protein
MHVKFLTAQANAWDFELSEDAQMEGLKSG